MIASYNRGMNTATIKVYGAGWCEDTQRTREHLDALQLPYQYIDVEQDPAAEAWITQRNNGKRKTPTVDLAGDRSGPVLIEPTNDELDEALKQLRPLSP